MCMVNKIKTTVYLACPYSNTGMELDDVFICATRAAAYLMVVKGYVVFSPITHSHPIDLYAKQPNHSFWLTQDWQWLNFCDRLFILKLPRWEHSFGVGWEHGVATALVKPIDYLDYEVVEDWIEGTVNTV